MAKMTRLALAATAALLLSGDPAAAQSAGSITGTVKDSSGAVLPGATVTVASAAIGVTQTVTSDTRGVFVALQLPPGTYTLSVEMQGFKRVEKGNVIVPTASKVNVGELLLEVGSLSEMVSVEADVGRLQIQSESAERSDLVTNQQLRDIALNGRNISRPVQDDPRRDRGQHASPARPSRTSSASSTSTARARTSTNTRWTASPT